MLKPWIMLVLAALPFHVEATPCQAKSGPQRAALLELYTSEGCSSCPPADRWLSGVAAQGFGADRVVPLAFHVDYWDYIGWPDRFAQPLFSARQREQVRLSGGRVVYTPQMRVNGRDFPDWRRGMLGSELNDANGLPAGADIGVSLGTKMPDRMEISVDAKAKTAGRAVLYVALYENGLTSEVRAGENRGATLHHDYVVRWWRGPIALSGAGVINWRQTLSVAPEWQSARMGIAAFVQDSGSGEVLQAVQLPRCVEPM